MACETYIDCDTASLSVEDLIKKIIQTDSDGCPALNTRRGIVYDPDAAAYFLAEGITNTLEKNAYNQLVLSHKTIPGLYEKAKAWYPVSPTSYGAALANSLHVSNFHLLEGIAPSYDQNGFDFDGVTQWLNMQTIPSTQMTLDDFTFMISSKNSDAGNIDAGSVNSTTLHTFFRILNAGNARLSYTSNATLYNEANATGLGNFFWTAAGAAIRKIYKDGVQLGSTNTAAHGTTPSDITMYLGARNNAGAADSFSLRKVKSAARYSTLTDAEVALVNAYWNTYNLNVISGGR